MEGLRYFIESIILQSLVVAEKGDTFPIFCNEAEARHEVSNLVKGAIFTSENRESISFELKKHGGKK